MTHERNELFVKNFSGSSNMIGFSMLTSFGKSKQSFVANKQGKMEGIAM